MKKLILALIGILGISFFGIAWMMSSMVLAVDYQDHESQVDNLKNNWIMTYEEILSKMGNPEKFEIESFDGVNIAGHYFSNSDSVRCGVVLSHGHTSGKTAMLKYADLFWDCGCDIVVYDHRGHGESDNLALPTAGIREKEDHLMVNEWLKSKTGLSNNQIGWMGASWGAATVIMAGADESEMAFIVADSPYQDWYTAIYERALRMYGGVVDVMAPMAMWLVDTRAKIQHAEASPMKAMSSVSEPVFLIHSRTDESTSSNQSVNISKHLNANSVFVHTDWGAGHCKDINTKPEDYKVLIHKFMNEKVPGFGKCLHEPDMLNENL